MIAQEGQGNDSYQSIRGKGQLWFYTTWVSCFPFPCHLWSSKVKHKELTLDSATCFLLVTGGGSGQRKAAENSDLRSKWVTTWEAHICPKACLPAHAAATDTWKLSCRSKHLKISLTFCGKIFQVAQCLLHVLGVFWKSFKDYIILWKGETVTEIGTAQRTSAGGTKTTAFFRKY